MSRVSRRFGVRPSARITSVACLFAALLPLVGWAQMRSTTVPLRVTQASTLYVSVEIEGIAPQDYLVDTGAGYTTIDEETLHALQRNEDAPFVKSLHGTLADGSSMVVPVYLVSRLKIGGRCHLSGVEVAVFPGSVRGILGLNALRRTAPFTLSLDPPSLSLAQCYARSD